MSEQQPVIHPNLKQLSNSSSVILHKCPRKYELEKLMPPEREHDVHTMFGTAVGIGVQTRLVTGSATKAQFATFCAWEMELDTDDPKALKDKKTFWHALIAVEKFEQLISYGAFSTFEIAYFEDGRPATELGFTINCGDGFYYRGFIDAVMICRRSNQIVVLECKTTKFSQVHEAMYKNSGQALGYSLIIDAIIARLKLPQTSSYKVYYPVFKSSGMEWEVLPFTKTNKKRAEWIKNILIDIKHIREYAEDEYFPMYGESCYDFFRPCQFFETCGFSNKLLFLNKTIEERVEKPSKYDFHFSLNEIIEAQLAAVSSEQQEEK